MGTGNASLHLIYSCIYIDDDRLIEPEVINLLKGPLFLYLYAMNLSRHRLSFLGKLPQNIDESSFYYEHIHCVQSFARMRLWFVAETNGYLRHFYPFHHKFQASDSS